MVGFKHILYISDFTRMWAKPSEAQARNVISQIQRQGPEDYVLVSSECGGRIISHRILKDYKYTRVSMFT